MSTEAVASAKSAPEVPEVVEVNKKILDELIEATADKATKLQSLILVPKTFEETERYAKYIRASQTCPRTKDGPWSEADIFIAIQTGLELGIPPMQAMAGIAIINGRATVWGDLALAIVLRSGGVEDWYERPMKEALAKGEGYFKIKRKDRATPTEVFFTITDAQKAGLWGKQGPWTQYPGRMLQMRARLFALRDCFPDALKGIPITEEVRDYPLVEAVTEATMKAPQRKSAGMGEPSGASAAPGTNGGAAAAAPAEAPMERVQVIQLKAKSGNSPHRITINRADGVQAVVSTFSDTLFADIKKFDGMGAMMRFEQKGQYLNVVAVKALPDDEPPVEQDEPGSQG